MADTQGRKTLARRASAEMEERKSFFIGTAAPIVCEADARALIDEMRRQYHDATHNVYAYLLDGGVIARYSDDGEPQGTAGIPVLNVLKMSGATDLCVVVTRYFGGILLGAGGLVRAYSASAKQAIDAAGIVEMAPFSLLSVRVSYSDYQRVTVQLPKLGVVEDGADFDDAVTIHAAVLASRTEEVIRSLVELTNGRVSVEIVGREERSAGLCR